MNRLYVQIGCLGLFALLLAIVGTSMMVREMQYGGPTQWDQVSATLTWVDTEPNRSYSEPRYRLTAAYTYQLGGQTCEGTFTSRWMSQQSAGRWARSLTGTQKSAGRIMAYCDPERPWVSTLDDATAGYAPTPGSVLSITGLAGFLLCLTILFRVTPRGLVCWILTLGAGIGGGLGYLVGRLTGWVWVWCMPLVFWICLLCAAAYAIIRMRRMGKPDLGTTGWHT